MELTASERLTLLSLLPKQSDYTTLKLVHKLQQDLSFGEEDHKRLQFQKVYHCPSCGDDAAAETCAKCGTPAEFKGRMSWLREADVPWEIPIGEKATDIIVEVLKDLNKQKKLTEAHMSLYKKFVGD